MALFFLSGLRLLKIQKICPDLTWPTFFAKICLIWLKIRADAGHARKKEVQYFHRTKARTSVFFFLLSNPDYHLNEENIIVKLNW